MCPLPPVMAGSPAAPEAGERLAGWQLLTREALAAQSQGELDIALAGYVRALWAAEALLGGPVLRLRPDDCLAALVVSHHNLADLYRHRGQHGLAVDHLCRAHLLLLRLSGDDSLPADVRVATWRHLQRTRAELLAWQREHGSEAAIDSALQAPPPSAAIGSPARLH
ncbi:MAG TPA: hypothetical protein PKA20_06205 [Burkholderiaceae bacterium]|nr:hypothetical protein [Burkholderiaceae bacterium]